MHRTLFSALAATALAGALLLPSACSQSNGAAPAKVCTPGNYVFCRCQNREEGTKLCNEEGSGFARCEPCETPDNPELPADQDPLPRPDLPQQADGGPPTTSGSCGNGVVEQDEECDDGNRVDDDGCSATCKLSGQNPLASRSCPGMDVHVWSKLVSYTGTTIGSTNTGSVAPSCPSAAGNNPTTGAAAPDRVFKVTAHKTGLMTVQTTDANFDNWIYVSTTCKDQNKSEGTNAYLICSNKNDGTGGETVNFPVEAGKSYSVFVDGVLLAQGTFRVSFGIQ